MCQLCHIPPHTRLANYLDCDFGSKCALTCYYYQARLTRQGIRDLGDGWWLFYDEPDWILEVSVSYEGTSFEERAASTVRDLWLPTNHAISPWEFRFSLLDFLRQFHSLRNRWGWEYELLTEEIIHSSAEWQEGNFLTSTLMPTHTHNEATVVAASLRCLAISNDISHITANWSTFYFRQENERHVRLADLERKPRGQDLGIRPSVDVWRWRSDDSLPDFAPQNRETLSLMLMRTFQLAQRLLCRGRPQDWPALFYVLCILLLVHGNLYAPMWTEATDAAANTIKGMLRELCHNLHRTTGNMQPLNSDLDLKRYSALVNENGLAVEHYRRMHEMWLANSECPSSRHPKQQIT